MAEDKKPTTRRAAAKKPAAKKAAPKPSEPTNEAPVVQDDPSIERLDPLPEAEADKVRAELERVIKQQEDKVATYNTLKERGLPIPAELRAEIEAAAPVVDNVQQAARYVRNCGHTLFRFKLARHTPGQRGIVLQPRGNRGDVSPIEPEDLNDTSLRTNLELGLIEVINNAEAVEVVEKQTTNQQSVHPAMSALRNEKGEAYGDGAFSVGPSPDQQAITVARLDDGQIAFDRQGIRNRVRGEAPGTPDYVGGAEPTHRPANEDPSYLSDLNARQRTANPADGLKVSVEPTVKTGNPAIVSDGFKGDK